MIASLLSRIGIEVWKDIPEYEGLYEVSNLGNVRSLNYRKSKRVKKIIKHFNKQIKRYEVSLYHKEKYNKSKTKKIHTLVAMAFLNHKPLGYKSVVDHIDNNSSNDKLYNLQKITQRKKMSKDQKNKTSKYTGVSLHKTNSKKKWKAEIFINGKKKFLGVYMDEKKAAQAYQNELKKINESKETHTDTTHT